MSESPFERDISTTRRVLCKAVDMGNLFRDSTAADMERRRRRPSTEDATLVRAAPAHHSSCTGRPPPSAALRRPGSAPGPQQGSHLVAQTALGSSGLPGRARPTGSPATASDIRSSIPPSS
eukprot:scaffold42686_cov56-Phaeocystis_antarctica.AAC.2